MIKVGPFDQESEFNECELVCYCFQFTRKQIEKNYVDSGRSVILQKIANKKAGECDCARRNPKDR